MDPTPFSSNDQPAREPKTPHFAWRAILISIGFISLGLGVLGIFLPLLPTTPFALVAVWCFSRSSPRFQTWLIHHRHFGPLIRDWREKGVIPLSAKCIALGTISFSILFIWLRPIPTAVQAGVTLGLLGVLVFLWSRPSR